MPQLIGPGDLIVASLHNLYRNLRAYAEMVVWFALLSVVQWSLLIVLQSLVPDKLSRLAFYALLSIPGSLAFLAVTAGIIDMTIKSIAGKGYSVGASLLNGFRMMISMLWVSILTSVLLGLGFMLLAFPAFIFFIWFKFAPYEVMGGKERGTSALAASRNLVTGRWWPVFVRVALPFIFFTIAASFVTTLTYIIIGATMGNVNMFIERVADTSQLSHTHTLITAVVPQTIRAFALALFLGADIALWLDLKKKG